MARCRYCNGCKALFVEKNHASCELGFNIRRTDEKGMCLGSVIDIMRLCADPNCPKPRTHKALVDYWLTRSQEQLSREK